MAEVPSHAKVVIIGGGAVGCSILYHLALRGWTDCVLLEKNELTAGSTWHAAGNCPSFSGSWSIMAMQNYSTRLYKSLGEAVDYPMNYHNTGSIRLAHTADRLDEFRRVAQMGAEQGIEFAICSNDDLKRLYPFLETHDLVGGLWDPTDGDIDPAQLTQALAKGARNLGAKVVRFCPVTAVARVGKEWQIETPKGTVRAEYVVNAAGYYAPEVGRMFGREVPSVVLEHQYLITETIPELAARSQKLPLLRDPDSSYYLRQEKHGLLLGPYEHRGAKTRWWHRHDPMPRDFSFQLYPDDLERISHYIEDACARVPILGSVGLTRVVNGPIPYAPDGNPLIGPMPGVPGAFEACVFTFGIVQAGGAGKLAAEWLIDGETSKESWSCDPRRFMDFATPAYTEAKAREVYENEYAISFQNWNLPAGRPVKTSPLYSTQAAAGAVFQAFGGWERTAWFGGPHEQKPTWDRGDWFATVKAEVEGVTNHVGLMEVPGLTRFAVSGEGAGAWMRRMITGALPAVGRVGLVYFATPKGKVLSEMTLARFATDQFMLMGAASARWHDRDWLLAHCPAHISIQDVTSQWSALVVAGPKSRALLEMVTDSDLSNAAFPWLTHQPITIGSARGFAARMTYIGELGWELHLPSEQVLAVWQLLQATGKPLSLVNFGTVATESMRLEKSYRSWKAELSLDYTMLEAGLERFVKLDKPEFIGKAALAAEAAQGSKLGFVCLKLDDHHRDAPALASILHQGKSVGLVTSGGWGHRVGHSIALGVVDIAATAPGTRLLVDVFGTRVGATVTGGACFDPDNTRLKG